MLDLLERKRLYRAILALICSEEGVERTPSFSTMAAAPRTEADSKVSMELSRWKCVSKKSFRSNVGTDVKRSQLLSVRIELVVVVFGELL